MNLSKTEIHVYILETDKYILQNNGKSFMKSSNREYFSCRYNFLQIERILNYQIKGLYHNGRRSMNCKSLDSCEASSIFQTSSLIFAVCLDTALTINVYSLIFLSWKGSLYSQSQK